MCDEVFFTTRRSQKNRYCLQAKLHEKIYECARIFHFCKESVACTLSTTFDLAIADLASGDLDIECLGVHAIQCLDVCVASNFVKMKKKKVARKKSSNLDSSIQILLAMLIEWSLPHSLVLRKKRNSVVLVLVEDLREYS